MCLTVVEENTRRSIHENLNPKAVRTLRIKKAVSSFKELSGVAYNWKNWPDNLEMADQFVIDNGEWFYDPEKLVLICVDTNISHEGIECIQRSEFTYIGKGNQAYLSGSEPDFLVYARPALSELPLPQLKGVVVETTFSSPKDTFVDSIVCGNLRMEVTSVYPYVDDLIKDFNFDEIAKAAEVIFYRDYPNVDGWMQKRFEGRHSDVAKNTFKKEILQLLKQLQQFGYENIVAFPSDERRANTYKKVGMNESNFDSDCLLGNIQTIIQNLESNAIKGNRS